MLYFLYSQDTYTDNVDGWEGYIPLEQNAPEEYLDDADSRNNAVSYRALRAKYKKWKLRVITECLRNKLFRQNYIMAREPFAIVSIIQCDISVYYGLLVCTSGLRC